MLELEQIEREEKRRQAGAKLSFERIAKQQRFMWQTGMIAILAIAFCLVSLLLIAYEALTSFSSLLTVPAPGDEWASYAVLGALAIAVIFLLMLAGFGVYIFLWAARKKKWLENEEELLRKELESLAKQKEAIRKSLQH